MDANRETLEQKRTLDAPELRGTKMKFWVTKYALTDGIKMVDADDPAHTEFPNMLVVDGKIDSFTQHFHGNDWHRSREAAVARAEEMRKTKLASLARSKAKLETMKF